MGGHLKDDEPLILFSIRQAFDAGLVRTLQVNSPLDRRDFLVIADHFWVHRCFWAGLRFEISEGVLAADQCGEISVGPGLPRLGRDITQCDRYPAPVGGVWRRGVPHVQVMYRRLSRF